MRYLLQVPGGPELLIIGLIFVMLLGLGVAIVGAGAYLASNRSDSSSRSSTRSDNPPQSPIEQRLADLEKRVETLEQRVEGDDERERAEPSDRQ